MRNAYSIQTVNKVITAQSIGNVGIPMGCTVLCSAVEFLQAWFHLYHV